MTVARIVGVILIAIGLVSFAWGRISWTREKTVIDVGPLEATTEERETIPLPRALGAVSLVAGVALLVIPVRRRA
jgi:uncharacterized membrane protein HdeD (DUF308 family)